MNFGLQQIEEYIGLEIAATVYSINQIQEFLGIILSKFLQEENQMK